MNTLKQVNPDAMPKLVGFRTSPKSNDPFDCQPSEPDYITCGSAQARLYLPRDPKLDLIVECGYLVPSHGNEGGQLEFSYSIPLHVVRDAAIVLYEAHQWALVREDIRRIESERRRD